MASLSTVADQREDNGAAVERWDFFVSYAQEDHRWAEWIAWHLEDAGYRVLIQAWDSVPGSNWQVTMQRGVTDCDRTIAILSEKYSLSVYGQREWQAVTAFDPLGFARRLIPVRVSDCDRPGLLGQIVSFDIFDLDENSAKKYLLAQISATYAGRAKPEQPPRFPGREIDSAPFPGTITTASDTSASAQADEARSREKLDFDLTFTAVATARRLAASCVDLVRLATVRWSPVAWRANSERYEEFVQIAQLHLADFRSNLEGLASIQALAYYEEFRQIELSMLWLFSRFHMLPTLQMVPFELPVTRQTIDSTVTILRRYSDLQIEKRLGAARHSIETVRSRGLAPLPIQTLDELHLCRMVAQNQLIAERNDREPVQGIVFDIRLDLAIDYTVLDHEIMRRLAGDAARIFSSS